MDFQSTSTGICLISGISNTLIHSSLILNRPEGSICEIRFVHFGSITLLLYQPVFDVTIYVNFRANRYIENICIMQINAYV